MRNEPPLYIRLYREAHLFELARIVGYDGLPEEERDKALPLLEKYGRQKMDEAQRLLLDNDKDAKRYTLKPDVRKLCWQLLGPPPEKQHELSLPPAGALPLTPPESIATESTNGVLPSRPKKPRKKKGEAHAS
jgi:hypothetical protein